MTVVRPDRQLRDALYTDVMVLADEARTYFEGEQVATALPPVAQVEFACEALRVTSRLTHVLAWLLEQRAFDAGELEAVLPFAGQVEGEMADSLPDEARRLSQASEQLVARARLLAAPDGPEVSPARALLDRLNQAL